MKKKLTYTMLNKPIIKEKYTFSIEATSWNNCITDYPTVDVICNEEELIELFHKFNEFLKNEELNYFEYDFDDKRYFEFAKGLDPYADVMFYLLYKIHNITYTNITGDKFLVKGLID